MYNNSYVFRLVPLHIFLMYLGSPSTSSSRSVCLIRLTPLLYTLFINTVPFITLDHTNGSSTVTTMFVFFLATQVQVLQIVPNIYCSLCDLSFHEIPAKIIPFKTYSSCIILLLFSPPKSVNQICD